MSRVPKAPLGFVPVDSEEARGIDGNECVNYAYENTLGWLYGNNLMKTVRRWQSDTPAYYHVQLPPAVEWEEVWGWEDDGCRYHLLRKSEQMADVTRLKTSEMDTIVRALNEMEGQNE